MDSPRNPLSANEKEAESWKQEPCRPHTEAATVLQLRAQRLLKVSTQKKKGSDRRVDPREVVRVAIEDRFQL